MPISVISTEDNNNFTAIELPGKVNIFWEGHNFSQNLHRKFVLYVVPVKSMVEILQNFVAFSEYMNFTAIADTDVNHLQEEQFSSTVFDLSSQDDSVQAFPEQVVLNSFVKK